MFARLLRRWADATHLAEIERLNRELDDLTEQLREERSRVRILELEQDNLLSVIERDRRRIESETKRFLAEGVAAELRTPHQNEFSQ